MGYFTTFFFFLIIIQAVSFAVFAHDVGTMSWNFGAKVCAQKRAHLSLRCLAEFLRNTNLRMWLCRREYFGPVDQRVLLKRHYKSLMKFSMDFYTLVPAWNAPNKSISFSVRTLTVILQDMKPKCFMWFCSFFPPLHFRYL